MVKNILRCTNKVKDNNADKWSEINSIIILHVLPTALEFIQIINLLFPIYKIIAIPYSVDIGSIKTLKKLGFDIVIPTSVKNTFEISRKVILDFLHTNTKQLIVKEVGGYLAKFTDEFSKYNNFIGIVEDTNNGHWRYEKYSPHGCPVVSIAQSPVKSIEDSIIGDAVIYSFEKKLRDNFQYTLSGKKAIVMGYGKIGKSSANALQRRRAIVSIYDIDPIKIIQAQIDGFITGSVSEIIGTCDYVIGCSGRQSINKDIMLNLKNGAILASGSSKDVEFDISCFKKSCYTEILNSRITKFTIKENNRYFFVLNNGLPINFEDYSILGEVLDLTYSELLLCMIEMVKGNIPIGLMNSNKNIQLTIANYWLNEYSVNFYNHTYS